MSLEINKYIGECKESSIRDFANLAAKIGVTHKMTLGEPDFTTNDIIKNEAINALKSNKTKYAPTNGILKLRERISQFEKENNNVFYDPQSEIIVTNGSTEGLTAALFSILNPGDEVIVPTPCYALYRSVIEFMGAKMVTLDTSLDDFQINAQKLEKLITDKTKALIITSPNNPTGVVQNKKTLDDIHSLCLKNEFYVICDDCYKELQYGKREIGFEKYQDLRDRIIICQSFSKPYAMTGFRIGYLMTNKELMTQIVKMHQYMIVCENTFTQYAAIKAFDVDVKLYRDEFKLRRDYLMSRLDKMGITYPKPDGAFYVFINIKKFGLTSFDFCKKLAEVEKLAIIPGYCFEAEGYARLSYAVSLDEIKICMDLLEDFITNQIK